MRDVAMVRVVVLVLLLSPAPLFAQPSQSNVATLSAFGPVERKATEARSGNAAAIRGYVDTIFDQSVFASVGYSIRDRVARAEVGFRAGRHGSVSEGTVVDVINEHVAAFRAPVFLGTNREQLRTVRQILRRLVPSLRAHQSPDQPSLTDTMSPAETTLAILHLGTQKLLNSEYQVSPDEWSLAHQNRIARGPASTQNQEAQQKRPPTLTARVDLPGAWSDFMPVGNLDDEASPAVGAIHTFLDRIGVQR